MPDSAVGVNFDYTYNGTLETDVIFCPTVDTPALSDLMVVKTGSKYKIQVALVGSIQNIIKKYSTCDRSYSDGIDITNTTVELTQLELNMEWCKDDFEQTLAGNILSEEMLRTGVDEFNPEGTKIQSIIDQLVSDAARRDTFRIFWFGDSSDPDTNWNQIEGAWAKMISQNTPGNAYCVRRTSTTLGTGALASGIALTALQEAYTESAIVLKQMPNSMKYFAVTGSVYENLLASYEANVNGTERQFTNLTNGQDGLTYRGIRVIPLYAWDQALDEPGNPLYGVMKHAILYTTPENHVVGVDVAGDSDKVSGWYERKDRKYYIEGFQRLGYNFICCDLQTISY